MPGLLSRVRRALLAALLLGSLLAGGRASAEDSFTLALSWQPGFCADRAQKAECKIAPKDKPGFTLHGLWPDWDTNGDGKRNAEDAFCIANAGNRKSMMALDGGNWLKMPPVKLSQASSDDLARAMPGIVVGLDRHEWWKHGTCSGLAPEDYFATAIVLLREVERGGLARLLGAQAGRIVARKELLEAFEIDFGRGSARALMLDCAKSEGASALQEIRIRLKRSEVTAGLTAASLAIPAIPARGDCAADVLIPAWPR
ncbi:ribonuclease T2 family protein [Dongia sp. agr-C8]